MTAFACRACGATDVQLVVSLGRTPLANALVSEAELRVPEDRFALDVVRCRACSLVQITETVPPERLFRHYAYFSSFSDTMLRHAEALVAQVVAARGLGSSSLAVEVASNDGYLLQFYRRAGVPVLGIEPAENIAAVARERGVETVSEFFGARLGRQLAGAGRLADVLHANNVLAHVPDLRGFVHGVRAMLRPGGVAIVEVPYVADLLAGCEFDTIYHEHLCYFSLAALDRLWTAGGLRVVDVEQVPIHGGSLRVFVEHDAGQPRGARVDRLLDEEARWGVDGDAAYEAFAGRVHALVRELGTTLRGLKARGARLAAYGAAAKGSTLLNVAGIGRDVLDFVADRSPHKQGRFMPGVHLPIVGPERLVEAQPDYVLLLTWNFADEILVQQSEYRRRGGRFIVPVPSVRVIEPL